MTPARTLSGRKLAALAVLILVMLSALIFFATHHPQKSVPKSQPVNSAQPPAAALAAVSNYLQAREDANGADQASPTAWLATVQPITTAEWFSQLQPSGASTTGTVPYVFTLAHQSGYVVKPQLSGCIWDRDAAQPTTSSGVIICSLYDVTFSTNGSAIGAAALPFGWAYSGQQPPPILKVVEQNGVWLIDNDLTGEGG